MALQEDALGNARVFDLGLEDVDGVVVEEVVDSALAGSEVFVGVFNDGLDEISVENEDLFKFISFNNFKYGAVKLTWRSYFNHLGAILGMASFSWSLR